MTFPLPNQDDGDLIDDTIWNGTIAGINQNHQDFLDFYAEFQATNQVVADALGMPWVGDPAQQRIEDLETSQGTQDTSISNLTSDVTTLDSRADAFDSDISALNTAVGIPYSGVTSLEDRVETLEASVSSSPSVHRFHASADQTVPATTWTRILMDVADETNADVSTSTVSGGTQFTFSRAGVWRVALNAAASSLTGSGGMLIAVSNATSNVDGRHVFGESLHNGSILNRWADNIGGLIRVPASGTLACWVYVDITGGATLETLNQRTACSFEWVAP